MSGIHDQDRIEALRRRLYERGRQPEPREPFQLKDNPTPVRETWNQPPQPVVPEPKPEPVVASAPPAPPASDQPGSAFASLAPMTKKLKHNYRRKALLAGVGFFLLAVAVSSILLIIGPSTISGENIDFALNGPFTIGGGEVLPLQVGITNHNSVPIESASLVIQYPLGTKSAAGESKELYIERLPLETIDPGETLNVPLRAVVFGEENEEKTITASIEYRVKGSNALFFKEAEPLRFKISSSPLVLKVDALKKISSGQETSIELTLSSNSPNPISGILVKAEYPEGFEFTTAVPETSSGNTTWHIDELAPEEHQKITVKGIIYGKETDEKAIHFTVGVPGERDPNTMVSVFTTADTEFEIEVPFIDVGVSIGGSTDSEVVLAPEESANIQIDLENTLKDTIYDAVVVAKLSGNALADLNVDQTSGFYDSEANTLTWDQTSIDALEEIRPGDSERLTFTVTPDESTARTPQLQLSVSVRGRRVSERDVPEELIGTAERNIKVVSAPDLLAEALHGQADNGPIPPRVNEETVYNIGFIIDNGSNEIVDVEVTAPLPTYVSWQDSTDGTGEITFNPTTRVVTWKPGELSANRTATASFKIAIKPSTSQIGTTPTLVGEQRLRATDNFTGSTVSATSPAVTTELPEAAGYGQGSGRVQSD